jgi:DNA (cytosine-5)-methyltransferase 1
MAVDISIWPEQRPYKHLSEFLAYPLKPLSVRAAEGFLSRAARSTLHFPDGFLDAIRAHVRTMHEKPAA